MPPKIIDEIIRVPADSTGKRTRTQTRQWGPELRHEHFYVRVTRRQHRNFFYANRFRAIQQTAENGSTTGGLWLFNTSSTVLGAVKVASIVGENASATANTTATRMALARFTFTGTPTGTLQVPHPARTDFPGPTLQPREASTGASVSVVAQFFAPVMHNTLTAVGVLDSFTRDWTALDEDGEVQIGNGEGVVFYQPDAGVASDPRRVYLNLLWQEYDA